MSDYKTWLTDGETDSDILQERVAILFAERDQLRAQVGELREQNADLRGQLSEWEAVPDGFEYDCQCADCKADNGFWQHKIWVNGSEIGICYSDNSDESRYVIAEHLRLQRRKEATDD